MQTTEHKLFIAAALKFAEQLEAGMVHINDCTLHDEPTAPFGGVKNGGFVQARLQFDLYGRAAGRCQVLAAT